MMGCDHHVHAICGQRLCFLSISLLFLIVSSWSQQGLVAEGRNTLNQNSSQQEVSDEKAMVRAMIGSRPPRCDGICRTCGKCEAIQVPVDPPVRNGKKIKSSSSMVVSTTTVYATRENTSGSNYKPMTWKCKCGNIIINP